MPCSDSKSYDNQLPARNNYLAQLLCALCAKLEADGSSYLDGELLQWWTNHKIHDARVAAAKKKLAEQGSQSLTGEELGLLWNE